MLRARVTKRCPIGRRPKRLGSLDTAGQTVTVRYSSAMTTKAEHEAALRERFGDVLTLPDLASVLRYPSTGAIRKARVRGQLPLQLVQMPPRRGWFATAEAVAELLCNLENGTRRPLTHHEAKIPRR